MSYEAAPFSLLAVTVISVILAALQWSVVETATILTWLAVVWSISGARLLLILWFHRSRPSAEEVDRWARWSLAGAILSGLSWGAGAYWLFAFDSLPHQAFLAIVIAGMAAGSVTTLSAQRGAALGFVLSSTLPLLLRFSQADHAFAGPMCLLISLFVLLLIPVTNRFYNNLRAMLVEHYQRRSAQEHDRTRNQVLELVAKGAALPKILTALVESIERHNPNMLCSILLLDESGERLLKGAAPSLPEFYNDAVHGLEIGSGVGSCGTAAATGERVVVTDIETHPYWADYRELAAGARLRACWSEPILNASGKLLGTFAIYHRHPHEPTAAEISEIANAAYLAGIAIERRRTDESLRLSGLVFHNSSEAMMITDEQNRIIDINPAFTELTGYSRNEVVGRNPGLLSSGRQDADFYRALWHSLNTTGRWQGELVNRRKNGEEYTERLTIDTIYDAKGNAYRRVGLFSDITEQKRADALIWTQANYDALTELPNRRLFMDRLEQGLKSAHREGGRLALLFIDLDRFKEVNDTLGHHMGDELLMEAAKRIVRCVRDSDTVARLGGDEFTVILHEMNNVGGVGRVSQQIIESLSRPYRLDEELAVVSASIGITIYPDDATEADELLKNADQAMFSAKQEGRNRYNYFTKSMQMAAQRRMRLTRDIHVGLAADQFSTHYQPIVELESGRIRKAEALLRWRHPVHGPISPADFIPVAEDTGAIHELGNRVFAESTERVKRWRECYDEQFQVSVNKSPVQFLAEGVSGTDWIEHLRTIGLTGEGIVVEITEGLLLRTGGKIDEKLLRFRDAGIQVAVDDFGTGYSSLAYLKHFDIDYLKIDQTFVSGLESDPIDRTLCEAIVVMAHKLGFKVIAEGVETEEQRRILSRMGCDLAQGYLFSKPMPADAFEALLQREAEQRTLMGSNVAT